MSIENGNGKKNGPRRQGAGALREYADIDKRMKGDSSFSSSINDPKYAEVQTRFEKRKIPLEVMDYALGLKSMPRPDANGQYTSRHEGRIAGLIREHSYDISQALTLSSKAHLRRMEKDPEFAATWRAAGEAWKAHYREGEHLGVAIPTTSYEQKRTKDLAPMPVEIHERISQYPAAVNYAIVMFTRELREWKAGNETQQKFARYFAEEVDRKAFRENPDARDRTRYENAYWALLDLKIASEEWNPNSKRKYPHVRIRPDELARHIERFITTEHIRREQLPALEGAERTRVEEELKQMPPNIIEALGNRLHVQTRSLPINDEDLDEALKELDLANAQAEAPQELAKNIKKRQETLSFLGRLLTVSSADVAHGTASMEAYLREGGTWDQAVQKGFESLMSEVEKDLRYAESQRGMANAGLGDKRITPEGAMTFHQFIDHLETVHASLLNSQSKLETLKNTYGSGIIPGSNYTPPNPETSRQTMREMLKQAVASATSKISSETTPSQSETIPPIALPEIREQLDKLQPHFKRFSNFLERTDISVKDKEAVEMDFGIIESIVADAQREEPHEARRLLSQLLDIVERYELAN